MYYLQVKLNQVLLVISHVFRSYLTVWSRHGRVHSACNKHGLSHRELIVIAAVTEYMLYVSILSDG